MYSISNCCPIVILKLYLSEYREQLDWISLSKRINDDFLIQNATNYPWNFETISAREDISIELLKTLLLISKLKEEEWDWDVIANQWDLKKLDDWGLNLISGDDIEESKNPNNIDTENIFATELDSESNYIVLKFENDIDWIQAKTIFELKTETGRRANGKEWSKGIGRVLNGVEAIKKIKNES